VAVATNRAPRRRAAARARTGREGPAGARGRRERDADARAAALSRLARLATGARPEASRDLRSILLRFPTHPHAAEALRLLSLDGAPTFSFEEQLSRAQALIAQGAPSEALAQLDGSAPPEGRERQAALARVALLKGQALLAKGQEADAFAQLELAASTGKPNTAAEAMMTKARRLMRAQDHQGARALMLALDQRYPDNGNAEEAGYLGSWLSLSDARFEQAVADFGAFEQRHPGARKRDEARWFRAWALFRLGRHADARNALDALIDDFPRSSLVPQARYWAIRFAQLGALRAVTVKQALDDGGVAEVKRASADGGVPLDVDREYRELVQAFPGTIYGALAGERLLERQQDAPRPFTKEPLALTVKPPASLSLALELAKTGLLRDAAEEVSRVVGTVATSDDALQLGHALQTIGEYSHAHGLAARWLWGPVYTGRRPEALMLMYPRAWRAAVEAHAADVGLDPFLAWAIMRRESGFRPEVVSSADARGLMQIIPPTAKAIAAELKVATPAPDDLYAPELNVRFGTWYLSALLERMGHPGLCAASYNAGPSAVAKWMVQRGHLPLDEWMEEIPYKETRGYVKQVLADYVIYRQLYGAKDWRLSLALPAPKTSGVAF
jgi:soluble lytic murein transglycosylase